MLEVFVTSVLVACAAGVAATRSAGTVELVAHRGESFDAPENTLAAIELAWKLGADAVEIDCHLTADGKLIVCHDSTTERTAGTKLVIRQCTAERLRQLDVGRWKGEKWAGQRMPLVEEALATVPPGKRMLIEMKCGVEGVPALEAALRASGRQPRQYMVVSFHRDVIAEVARRLPEHRTLLISDLKKDRQTGEWSPTVEQLIADAQRIGATGISVAAREPVNREFVRKAREAKLEFHVWTIDDPALARRMVEYGVDGITTNRAAWMRKQLEGK